MKSRRRRDCGRSARGSAGERRRLANSPNAKVSCQMPDRSVPLSDGDNTPIFREPVAASLLFKCASHALLRCCLIFCYSRMRIIDRYCGRVMSASPCVGLDYQTRCPLGVICRRQFVTRERPQRAKTSHGGRKKPLRGTGANVTAREGRWQKSPTHH